MPPAEPLPPPAPFLKWAGGKRQLLPALLPGRPATFNRYIEPFLGGGAVLFALNLPGERCVAGDVNPELINVYEIARDRPEALITRLRQLEGRRGEAHYYEVRASRPRTPLGRAARLIYLNKTCFNGLYRENGRGEFNVPWGGERRGPVCDPGALRSASARLAGVTLTLGDFGELCAEAGPGDWLYADPPYLPLSPSASFASYAKGGFGPDDHERLAAALAAAAGRGAFVMLSNSDTPATRDIYAGLTLHGVDARRNVAAKGSGRAKVREVIGVSYPTAAMADPAAFGQIAEPAPDA